MQSSRLESYSTMIEFCVQRRGQRLEPLSASDRAEMVLLPERRIITITAAPKAPLKLQRWFHAMLQLLVEATGLWGDVRAAKRDILIRTGFFESVVINGDGSTRFNPQSTAEWGLIEWRAFLDRAVPFVIENYVGESRANFRNRVDAFLGIKLAEALREE